MFYILLSMLIVGILGVVLTNKDSVFSSIGVGLMTGAIVGLVSSVVNYVDAWQGFINTFFERLYDLHSELHHELIRSKMKIEEIETTDKQKLIDQAKPLKKEDVAQFNEEWHRYDKYRLLFDSSTYASLFFRKSTQSCLDELEMYARKLSEIAVYSRTGDMFVGFQEGHFSSKEEEEFFLGDRDEFYEHVIQSNYKWRDFTAYCLRLLPELMSALQQSIKPFTVGEEFKEMPQILNEMNKEILKDLPARNPLEEDIQEAETSLETEDETLGGEEQKPAEPMATTPVSTPKQEKKKCRLNARLFVWTLIGFLLFVCLWAIAAIELCPYLRVPTGYESAIVKGINNIALGLSYSYIAGLILYFFTVALPDCLKKLKFQPVIKSKIKGLGSMLHNMLVPFSSVDNPVFLSETENITAMMKAKDWNARTIIPLYPGNTTYLMAFHSDCESLQREVSQIIADYKHMMDTETVLLLEDIRSASVYELVEIGVRVGGGITTFVSDAISEQFPKKVVEIYLQLAGKYHIEDKMWLRRAKDNNIGEQTRG